MFKDELIREIPSCEQNSVKCSRSRLRRSLSSLELSNKGERDLWQQKQTTNTYDIHQLKQIFLVNNKARS